MDLWTAQTNGYLLLGVLFVLGATWLCWICYKLLVYFYPDVIRINKAGTATIVCEWHAAYLLASAGHWIDRHLIRQTRRNKHRKRGTFKHVICPAGPRKLKKLIIDSDPGCDDTVALLVALGCGKFDLLGVTTIYGNSTIDHTTTNAQNLLAAIGSNFVGEGKSVDYIRDIPVYRGASGPWSGNQLPPPVAIHGENGLGDADITKYITDDGNSKKKVQVSSAAQFIVDTCDQYPGQVHFLFDGPVTNLADAMKLDPLLHTKWASVAIMGGAFHVPGNVSSYAEANFREDPDAAAHIFKIASDIRIVGLDITQKCPLNADDINEMAAVNQNGKMLSEIYQLFLDFYVSARPEIGGAPPHDAVALMALLRPDLFIWKTGAVTMTVEGDEIGRSCIAEEGPTPDYPKNIIAAGGFSAKLIKIIKGDITDPKPAPRPPPKA